MKVYKGVSASPGLVLGQVSRLEHHVETFSHGPFNPERELRLLANAVHTAQNELDSMAERAAPTEQAIFLFQSMMLDDEGMMNEVRFCINAGISASAAMHQVGQRYADQLANMKDNPYMQLRSVDILDATRRVINILTNRPRVWLALDHPVILAADRLMPTDLFSVPSGMILGVITAEGSGQSHAAIIARAMNIPGIVQVGKDFLDDCDGRTVILDATNGNCILDPDAVARQQAEASICQLQREDAEMKQLHSLPDETRDGEPFELLANCFGPEDIDTAMQSGAKGVGLLRSGYMMLPGRILDEQAVFLLLLLSGGGKRLPGDRAYLRLWLRPHRGRCQSGAAVLQAWPARHPQQPAPAPAVPDPDLCLAARRCPGPAAGDVPHGDRCRGLGRRHEHCGALPPEPAGAGRAL